MNRDKSDAPAEKQGQKTNQFFGSPSGNREPAGKERHRRWLFLVVDIVLLLGIVAAIIFMVSLLTPFSLFDKDGKEARHVTYTVELAGVYRDSVSALRVGDVVIDKETGAVIGTVTAVNARAYAVYTDIPSETKDPVLDSYVVTKIQYPEEFNTVEITIAVEADYEAGVGYAVDDCRIAVGRSYELNFPGYAGKGICIKLNEA